MSDPRSSAICCPSCKQLVTFSYTSPPPFQPDILECPECEFCMPEEAFDEIVRLCDQLAKMTDKWKDSEKVVDEYSELYGPLHREDSKEREEGHATKRVAQLAKITECHNIIDGLAEDVKSLYAENLRLRVALRDSISRPKGVVPDSALEFYEGS